MTGLDRVEIVPGVTFTLAPLDEHIVRDVSREVSKALAGIASGQPAALAAFALDPVEVGAAFRDANQIAGLALYLSACFSVRVAIDIVRTIRTVSDMEGGVLEGMYGRDNVFLAGHPGLLMQGGMRLARNVLNRERVAGSYLVSRNAVRNTQADIDAEYAADRADAERRRSEALDEYVGAGGIAGVATRGNGGPARNRRIPEPDRPGRTRHPRGGGGRGGGRGHQDDPEALAAARDRVDLQHQQKLLEAQGDTAGVQRIRDREREAEIVRSLVSAHVKRGEAEATAARYVAEEAAARADGLARAKEETLAVEATNRERQKAADDYDAAKQRTAYWADHELGQQRELARLAGNGELLRSLSREEEIRRRIAEYTERGKDADAARTLAVGELGAEARAEAIGSWRDVFTQAVTGAMTGQQGWLTGFWTSILNRAASSAADSLWDALSGALQSYGGGGNSGGGWLSSILNLGAQAFGGKGFASGTLSAPGGWDWVGERGPELRFIAPGTRIVPHGESLAMANGVRGPAMQVSYAPTYNIEGAGPREVDILKAEMARDRAEFHRRFMESYAKASSGLQFRGI